MRRRCYIHRRLIFRYKKTSKSGIRRLRTIKKTTQTFHLTTNYGVTQRVQFELSYPYRTLSQIEKPCNMSRYILYPQYESPQTRRKHSYANVKRCFLRAQHRVSPLNTGKPEKRREHFECYLIVYILYNIIIQFTTTCDIRHQYTQTQTVFHSYVVKHNLAINIG